MGDEERNGRSLVRSWQELLVSFVGYVFGFIVILFVLDLIGMIQRQPQQAIILAVVIPLVPFLILLAYSGRIKAVKTPGGIEITFDETDYGPERDGTQQSSDRRTILKVGGIIAAIGAIWGLVSQWDAVVDTVFGSGESTDDGDGNGDGGSPTDTQTDTQTDPQANTETETPGSTSTEFRMGGEFIASVEADVDGFDPTQRGGHVATSKVLNPVYEGLMATDFQGRPQHYLAESVDIEDGTNVTITLRDGVTFHDHDALDTRTVTAEDVLSTFERYNGTPFETEVSDWYRFGSGTVVDERILEIELTRKYAPLLFSIGVPIVPKEAADGDIDLSRNPVGTGPYVFETYESDRLVRLRKNERYWVTETDAFDDVSQQFPQEGVLDAVTFRVIPEESDQVEALTRGEIDLADNPPDSAIPDLRENDRFTVAETTSGRVGTLVYPMHEDAATPFQNRNVRLGVNRLILREAIVETAYDGIGRPAYAPISPVLTPFTSEEFQEQIGEQYARYDRETAQSLLEEGFAEAGFDTPFETTIVVAERSQSVQTANIIAQSMDTQFFDVETDVVPFPTLVETALTEDSHTKNQIVIIGWSAGWDPDSYVHSFFHSEQNTLSCCNINHYSNPEVDQLIETGLTTYDIEARADIYEQLQVEIVRDSPVAFTRFGANQSVYANAHVKGWNEYPFESGEYNGIYAPYAGKFTWVEKGQ